MASSQIGTLDSKRASVQQREGSERLGRMSADPSLRKNSRAEKLLELKRQYRKAVERLNQVENTDDVVIQL